MIHAPTRALRLRVIFGAMMVVVLGVSLTVPAPAQTSKDIDQTDSRIAAAMAGFHRFQSSHSIEDLRATSYALHSAIDQRALCRCKFASDDMNEALRKTYGPTFDHIVAYTSGGSSDIENLRLVHDICNRRRASGKQLSVPSIPRQLR